MRAGEYAPPRVRSHFPVEKPYAAVPLRPRRANASGLISSDLSQRDTLQTCASVGQPPFALRCEDGATVVKARTVTIEQASVLTGISKQALRKRVERGHLPYVLEGGLRHVAVAELDRRGLLLEPLSPAEPEDRTGEIVDRLGELLREATGLLDELRVEQVRKPS